MGGFYSRMGWAQEWATHEELGHLARERKEGTRVAKEEAKMLGERKEDIRLLATELDALGKAFSPGFPANKHTPSNKTVPDDGIFNTSAQGVAQQPQSLPQHHVPRVPYTSPDNLGRKRLKDWYWTHIASRANCLDAEAFERQWRRMDCVCVDRASGRE